MAIATLMLMTSATMAFTPNNNPEDITNKQLRTEITELIDTPDLGDSYEEQLRITFMVNKANEAIVMDVDTENKYLENYVKANLNYKELETVGAMVNTPYHVKITYRK